jgi:hypothetical protein
MTLLRAQRCPAALGYDDRMAAHVASPAPGAASAAPRPRRSLPDGWRVVLAKLRPALGHATARALGAGARFVQVNWATRARSVGWRDGWAASTAS